jgi:hypothetical protein
MLMNPSAVLPAAKQGNPSVLEIVALVMPHDIRCTRPYVLSVAKRLKYHLNPVAADRYIVAIATVKPNHGDNLF